MALIEKSRKRLKGVHPDLVKVVERAAEIANIGEIDLLVLEGLRTIERQIALKKAGASLTLRSRHLPDVTGVCYAVDLMAVVRFVDKDGDGKDDDGIFGARWDWPLYPKIAEMMKQAAHELQIPIEWGGDWKKLKDGPHFQLPEKQYPAQMKEM